MIFLLLVLAALYVILGVLLARDWLNYNRDNFGSLDAFSIWLAVWMVPGWLIIMPFLIIVSWREI